MIEQQRLIVLFENVLSHLPMLPNYITPKHSFEESFRLKR